MPISKLRPAYTLQDDRLEQMKALFPEAFADGELDWDALRDILGAREEEDGDIERFGLFWPGKRQARRAAAIPPQGTLVPCPGQGIDEETTRNIFIEGENLEVLKLLRKAYAGKVKLIYIDPPYNTGRDQIYPDDYTEPLETYLQRTGQVNEEHQTLTTNTKTGGRFHSNWLSVIYPRLQLARDLLTADGAIFVPIDNNEVHNLRLLLDEVFGEENFISCIANVNNPKGRSDDKYVATAHEYLMVYRRSEETAFGGWDQEEKVIRRYTKLNEDGRRYRVIDLRKTGANDRREDRPNLFYYFLYNPETGDFYPTRSEEVSAGYVQIFPLRGDNTHGRWRWELTTSMRNLQRLVPKLMPVRQVWSVFEKDYFDPERRIKPTSAWTKREFNSEQGPRDLIELDFSKETFPNPKPVALMEHILDILTKTDDEDLILDFYAGSATTAHAVLRTNRKDGRNRRFICVQFPELTAPDSTAYREGFRTISEIAKERIRRVLLRMTEEDKGKLTLDGRDEPEDLGFKVLKLQCSSFKRWHDYDGESPHELQARLDGFESPLVDDWSPQDLIVEVMLQAGFPVDSRVTRSCALGENPVDIVSSDACEHRLWVCLDAKLSSETVAALSYPETEFAEQDIFVCLDAALTDELKLRLDDCLNVKVI